MDDDSRDDSWGFGYIGGKTDPSATTQPEPNLDICLPTSIAQQTLPITQSTLNTQSTWDNQQSMGGSYGDDGSYDDRGCEVTSLTNILDKLTI